jgi:hypothetical protein
VNNNSGDKNNIQPAIIPPSVITRTLSPVIKIVDIKIMLLFNLQSSLLLTTTRTPLIGRESIVLRTTPVINTMINNQFSDN